MHLWEQAKQVQIQTSPDIIGGFSIGFDDRIPEETRDELMRFVYWVEDNYSLPVTLWVDFKFNHYLLDKNRQQAGFRFYWVEFSSYPVFDKEEDIPVIELPVRTEHWTTEEILASFTEAITYYFAWLTNQISDAFLPDPQEVETILQTYLEQQTVS